MADAAAGAVDHHRLPRAQAQLVVQPAQGGDPVGAQRPRLVAADAGRNERDVVLGDGDVLGVEAAPHRVAVDAIADLESLRRVADSDDRSGAVVAEHLGKSIAVAKLELAAAGVGIPDADARDVEADQHLVRPRGRDGERLHPDDLGATEPIDGRGLHRLRN